MLSLRSLCSEDDDFEYKARTFGEVFINRGYPLPLINKSISKSEMIPCSDSLLQKLKRNNYKLRLVLPYQSQIPNSIISLDVI